jgi:hypothetical protein
MGANRSPIPSKAFPRAQPREGKNDTGRRRSGRCFFASGQNLTTPSCILHETRTSTEESLEGPIRPITQATGHNNTIVAVYADRIELKTGWQSQNVESIGLREVALINIKGLVNVTLTIETNKGRVYTLNRMALPDARRIKNTFQRQKQRAGLYE